MKKLVSMVLLVCIVSAFAIAEKVIAVATFDVVGDAVSKGDAEAITELYIAELETSGKVIIADRINFNKILAELKFQASDWSDAKKTIRLGKAVNAEVISRGKIMKLGSKFYISATLIEPETATVLSSSKAEFKSLDNAPDVLMGFTARLLKEGGSAGIDIGDIGPGGGIVFHIEVNKAWEVSEKLGETNWQDAKNLCNSYRGGSYDDWYLPTKEELNLIYVNLRKRGKIAGDSCFWSSSEYNFNYVWFQYFSDGHRDLNYKYNRYSVRAVRVFNTSSL